MFSFKKDTPQDKISSDYGGVGGGGAVSAENDMYRESLDDEAALIPGTQAEMTRVTEVPGEQPQAFMREEIPAAEGVDRGPVVNSVAEVSFDEPYQESTAPRGDVAFNENIAQKEALVQRGLDHATHLQREEGLDPQPVLDQVEGLQDEIAVLRAREAELKVATQETTTRPQLIVGEAAGGVQLESPAEQIFPDPEVRKKYVPETPQHDITPEGLIVGNHPKEVVLENPARQVFDGSARKQRKYAPESLNQPMAAAPGTEMREPEVAQVEAAPVQETPVASMDEILQASSVEQSRSFEELYQAIDAVPEFEGSLGTYTKAEMKRIIEIVRSGNGPINAVTSKGGLRVKVAQLMAAEIAGQYQNQQAA